MITIEYLLIIGSLLILISIGIAKISDNLGVPTLLLFLIVGMLAGSDGPGGIYFDDADLSQSIGIIALIFILFSGGLDTNWSSVKPVFLHSTSLAIIGVLLTALSVGIFAHFALKFSLFEGLLLGAIISSTDAAAVFSVLRSKNVSLKSNLKPLLELESGSNDPMAVFLTVGLIQIITSKETSFSNIFLMFFFQMGIGLILGIILGKLMIYLINNLKFPYEGIYPVFSLSFACFIYAITSILNGSGFLAIYIAGIVVGNSEFVQKRSLLRFFDGLAWLSQIGMFLILGLLVFPSRLVPIIGIGFLISIFLIFIGRPISVFISLIFSKLHWREKAFISWVGLRGAVPIILATFPLLAGLPNSELIFNVVFFIVLSSAILQGWSIPTVAKFLKVDAPPERKIHYPIEFTPTQEINTDLVELIIPYNSMVIGKSIVEINLPQDSLIVLIVRNEKFIVPSGGTILESGDTILVLCNKENLVKIREILAKQKV